MGFSTLLAEGGPIMPLIVGTALVGYVLAVERLLTWSWWHWRDGPLRRAHHRQALARAVERVTAWRWWVRRPTPLAHLLARAKALGPVSPGQLESVMHAEVLSRLPEVDARIATIGWLGGILPMLGLLGTVSGMIATFQDLAETTSRQVLSQGLSEALWTTEVGLLGALPLLATHHLLTRMRARWLTRLEIGLARITGWGPAADAAAAAAGGGEREP